MADYWVIYQGQVGLVLRAQLEDADGPVDLSQFSSVTVTLAASASATPVVTNAACVIDVNQSTEVGETGKGWLSYTTNSTSGNLAVNNTGYVGSFKCMDGSTPHYFPKQKDGSRTYFRFIVHEALS